MKKFRKTLLVLFLLTVSFFGMDSIKASTFTEVDSTSVTYTSGASTEASTAVFKYKIDGNDVSNGKNNGLCLQPRYVSHDSSFSSVITLNSSNDNTYYYTIPGTSNKLPYRAIVYYTYNAPGWTRNSGTMTSKYSSRFSGHATYDSGVYSAVSAVTVSYALSYNSSFNGVSCGYDTDDSYNESSSYACDWDLVYACYDSSCSSGGNKVNTIVKNWESDIKSLYSELYTLWQTDKGTADGFKAYYHEGSGQDLMVWEYKETPKAYIKVTKDFTPNDSNKTATFRLYKCAAQDSSGRCTSIGAQIGENVTINEGQTGKLGLNTSGQAMLDVNTPYLIWESGEVSKKMGDYNVSFSNVDYERYLETNNNYYLYGQIKIGTSNKDSIGYYNSTSALVKNTKTETGYIRIKKVNSDIDFSTYHFSFDIYNSSNTYLTTLYSNNEGYAYYGLNSSSIGTLPAGSSYVVKEKVDSDGYAKVYNSSNQEYTGNERPKVYPNSTSKSVTVTITNKGYGTGTNNDAYVTNINGYCLSIEKNDGSDGLLSDAKFEIYNSNTCVGNVVATKTTNANGAIEIKGLTNSTYYAKEIVAPLGYSIPTNNCVLLTASQEKTYNSTCNNNVIVNDKLYLGFYKVKEDGTPLTEAKFKVKNSSGKFVTVSGTLDGCYVYSGVNDSGTELSVNDVQTGYYCISKIPNDTYTIVEQSTNNDGYYFENGGSISLVPSTTKVMTKVQGNTIMNSPYSITFYKVREGLNSRIENTKFKIKESGTDNYIKVDGKSSASGYSGCYIYKETTNENDASVLSSDSDGKICVIRVNKNKTYDVIETESGDLSYYVDDSQTFTVTPKQTIESINDNNTLVNKPYHLSFYKVKEDGTPLTNAKFIVKKGNEFIKTNQIDSDGCYIYNSLVDSENDASALLTDSNGRICITRVPNGEGYKAIEKDTNDSAYFIFENGEIDLEIDKSIKGKEASNTIINKPYVINFYKVLEDNETKVGGAEFVITNSSNKYVKVSGISSENGYNGCYIYDGLSDTKTDNTKLISSSENKENGISIGEVCVIRIPKTLDSTYKVTETKAPLYHTFGTTVTKNIVPNKTRQIMTNDNKFVNYKTEFKFTKTVNEENNYDDVYKDMTTEEITKIPFTIYDSNNEVVSLIKVSDGRYEYKNNTLDGVTGEETNTLYLDNNREFYVYHLPKGIYTVKENECCCEETCISPSNNTCFGYYSPNYKQSSSYTFTIDDCSTSNQTGKDEFGNNVCTKGISTQTLDNKPTEVDFTKTDFYSYLDPSEVVKFENEEEISIFDGITFKVYYIENGEKVYLDFTKVKDSGTCKDENSYSEYRYISGDISSNTLSRISVTKELHTCGGHIKITHLCRGRKYYIEEVSVPNNSIFTLPETSEARTRELDIECCNGENNDKPTTTTIIEDKPTRIVFEKRDSKYGYLLQDETTTFELYKCDVGVNCHPSDYSNYTDRENAGIKLVKFYPRSQINDDLEDHIKEVYRMVTNDTNVNNFVTDLHPYNGSLVLRYLQGGYNYVLLEKVSPKGYTLPKGRRGETPFTVDLTTVDTKEIEVINKPTSLLIRKYDDNGNLLPGAQFKIYEKNSCDSNKTAREELNDTSSGSGILLQSINNNYNELKLKTIRDGVYENREVKDTSILVTCQDKPDNRCIDIKPTLSLDRYVETWTNFDNSLNQNNESVEIREGEILIQYLDYDKCYIIEEVKAPKGYSLPEDEEKRFTKAIITRNIDVVDTLKELVNRPTKFTFYKYDEYNNLIDGGEFKLQKLSNDKKYEDITVTEENVNNELFYKVDKNSDNKIIRTNNGYATVYYLEEGQYRIVETKAPDGMELPNKEINVAVFYVDENGRVIGNSIITNKPKTEKIEVKPSSSAELIVNITTGITRVKYGLIICVIILLITGLLYINRKKN